MKQTIKGLLSLSVLATMAACSGSKSGSSSPSSDPSTKGVTVSGKINGTLSSMKPIFGVELSPASAAVFSVRCVTLSGPLATGTGVVDQGNQNQFSVSLTTAVSAPLGCFLLKDDEIAAIFAFKKSTSVSGGNAMQTGYAPKSDSTALDLGTIALNGMVAEVTPSSITENGSAAATALGDLTGIWVPVTIHEDPANNVFHPCEQETQNETELAQCKARWSASNFFLHMFRVNSTGSEDPRLGLALWDNKAAFDACGGKEAVNVTGPWALDGSYNQYASGVTAAFSFSSVDLTNLSTTVLNKAKFRKSTEGGFNNCPKGDDHTTELAGCDAATKCGDFNFASITDGETRSMEKVRCVMNSLVSGGDSAYDWGNVCGRRMSQEIWDMLMGGSPAAMNNNGNGCASTDCGVSLPWRTDPHGRNFLSELFVAGNIGTASQTEEITEHVGGQSCDITRTTGMTITQTSSTTASITVDFSMVRTPGGQWNASCLNSDWITSQYNKVSSVKIDLRKQ